MKKLKATFAVCSICLRVRRGADWVEATHVIRQIRSYEFDAPPRMRAGVCEYCAAPIFGRRVEARQRFAA